MAAITMTGEGGTYQGFKGASRMIKRNSYGATFQHILENVFQQKQTIPSLPPVVPSSTAPSSSSPLSPPSLPLTELKRRLEWSQAAMSIAPLPKKEPLPQSMILVSSTMSEEPSDDTHSFKCHYHSGQKEEETDDSLFQSSIYYPPTHRPHHPNHYQGTTFDDPIHLSFPISPSISSVSTASSFSTSTLSSFSYSPELSMETYESEEDDEEEDEEEYMSGVSITDPALLALVQQTLEYIHSFPSHHPYSDELQSLVPKMDDLVNRPQSKYHL